MKPETFTLVCELQDGRKRPVFTAPKRYAKLVDSLGVGEEVQARITEPFRAQGTQSMRYYFGVVIPAIAQACGYDDPDDYPSVHESLAWKFLRRDDHPLGYPRRWSLKKSGEDAMSQPAITAYIDTVILYAERSFPGCAIPRPGDLDLSKVHAPNWDDVAA